jgi:general secretion pathway protein M
MRSQILAGAVPIALFLMVLAAMVSLAAAPYVRLSALEQSIARNQETLSDQRQQISREAQVRRETSDIAALGQDASLLIEGETTGIAGANLQRLLSDLVLKYGGIASSLQILPPNDDGNLVRISMSLSMSVNVDGLREILYRLETGAPLIFIDDISVHTMQDGFRDPDPHYIGPLDVVLKLSAFAAKEGAP